MQYARRAYTHTNYQWLCLPMNGCSRQIEFEANSSELIYNTQWVGGVLQRQMGCDAEETVTD